MLVVVVTTDAVFDIAIGAKYASRPDNNTRYCCPAPALPPIDPIPLGLAPPNPTLDGLDSYTSVTACPGVGSGVVMLSAGNGCAMRGGFVGGQEEMKADAREAAWFAVRGVCIGE